VLPAVIDLLACPTCEAGMYLAPPPTRAVRCRQGHSFDLARQGYLTLLAPGASPTAGDTPAMLAARAAFLQSPPYTPLRTALKHRALAPNAAGDKGGADKGGANHFPAVVLDVGAGTGDWVADVVEAAGAGGVGVAMDVSKAAGRRAARVHPRVGAIVADGRVRWPLRTGVADLVLNVFAPRNGGEMRRVLRPDGILLVVAPAPGHLAEIRDELGLLAVDGRKHERIEAQLDPHFAAGDRTELTFTMQLGALDLERLVMMGPNAFHQDLDQLRAKLARLPAPLAVTAAVTLTAYRPR
jgi:23S rRNA (guanine745-N1)-methyltransferase